MSAMAVSIVMPVYEPKKEHLLQALESVHAQTYPHWTLLIRDDASTIHVEAMVEPYLNDPRITFIRNEHRKGIGGNWNAALACAKGDYIQFLFQDDVWKPHYIEKSVDALEKNPSAGFATSNHRYLVEGDPQFKIEKQTFYDHIHQSIQQIMQPGLSDGVEFLSRWLDHGLYPNVIGEPSFVMLRRSLVDRVGLFHETMKQGLDMDYWIRALLQSSFIYLSDDVGMFRVHASGASAQNFEQGAGSFDRLQCLELLLHSPLGRKARHTVVEQIAVMIGKYRARKNQNKGGTPAGKGVFLRFCLRHPFLILRGCIGYLFLGGEDDRSKK